GGGGGVVGKGGEGGGGGGLARKILSTFRAASTRGYEIARLSTFLGRPMRHSGWFPDYVLRLFRREKARFSNDPVHERVICEGPISRLSGVLHHHPVLRLEDAPTRDDSLSQHSATNIAAKLRVMLVLP